jgi:hypothetical protein
MLGALYRTVLALTWQLCPQIKKFCLQSLTGEPSSLRGRLSAPRKPFPLGMTFDGGAFVFVNHTDKDIQLGPNYLDGENVLGFDLVIAKANGGMARRSAWTFVRIMRSTLGKNGAMELPFYIDIGSSGETAVYPLTITTKDDNISVAIHTPSLQQLDYYSKAKGEGKLLYTCQDGRVVKWVDGCGLQDGIVINSIFRGGATPSGFKNAQRSAFNNNIVEGEPSQQHVTFGGQNNQISHNTFAGGNVDFTGDKSVIESNLFLSEEIIKQIQGNYQNTSALQQLLSEIRTSFKKRWAKLSEVQQKDNAEMLDQFEKCVKQTPFDKDGATRLYDKLMKATPKE